MGVNSAMCYRELGKKTCAFAEERAVLLWRHIRLGSGAVLCREKMDLNVDVCKFYP